MRNLFLFFFLLVIIFPLGVKCQDTLQNQDQFIDIALSFNINATKFENSSFINSLKQANLPVALNNVLIGFSSDIYLSKLRPGAKLIPIIGLGVVSEKKSNGNISVTGTALSNDYSIHYVIRNSKRQFFYPGIGFGWLQYKYNFVNHTNSPGSYSDALQNFSGERNIQSADLAYLNFAADYDFSIDKSNDLFLGLRATYHLGLNSKNLQLSDGTELEQSPKLKANALFVGIALTIE